MDHKISETMNALGTLTDIRDDLGTAQEFVEKARQAMDSGEYNSAPYEFVNARLLLQKSLDFIEEQRKKLRLLIQQAEQSEQSTDQGLSLLISHVTSGFPAETPADAHSEHPIPEGEYIAG